MKYNIIFISFVIYESGAVERHFFFYYISLNVTAVKSCQYHITFNSIIVIFIDRDITFL